ncbi:hypothetical protein LP7551_04460 [Roseibium album]|nr:hypothetical protein LP7551_04460 [Roseibium album]
MPYLIRSTDIDEDAIHKKFVPDFPMSERRPFLNGVDFTQEQIDAIPRTLLVSAPEGGKGLPELTGWDNSLKIVAPLVKEFLEQIEPDVHEFIPLHVKRDDESEDYGTYYLILIRQTLDALIFEETPFGANDYGLGGAKKNRFQISRFGSPVLRRSVCEGRHLWRGAGKLADHYFCSNKFGEFIKKNAFRGWKLDECVMRP